MFALKIYKTQRKIAPNYGSIKALKISNRTTQITVLIKMIKVV